MQKAQASRLSSFLSFEADRGAPATHFQNNPKSSQNKLPYHPRYFKGPFSFNIAHQKLIRFKLRHLLIMRRANGHFRVPLLSQFADNFTVGKPPTQVTLGRCGKFLDIGAHRRLNFLSRVDEIVHCVLRPAQLPPEINTLVVAFLLFFLYAKK